MTIKYLIKNAWVLSILISLSTQITKAQQTGLTPAIYIDENHSISLSAEDHKIYVYIINPTIGQGTGYLLFEPTKDSIPPFVFNSISPTISIKKNEIIGSAGNEVKQFNDLLNVDINGLQKQINTLDKNQDEFLNSFFGYYSLREKNVYQIGTSCFIGTIDDFKKGNYSVIGINTCANEVIYYLAFFEKKLLQKVHLSNGITIGNFIKNYDSYAITASDQDEQTYIYETYSKGKCTKATISSKKDDFYIRYDQGGFDLSYLYSNVKQTNFKLFQKPEKIFIYQDSRGNDRYYSQYGRSIAEAQFLGDPGEQPKTLNFSMYNNPKGTSVTIGEYKPKIVAQRQIEYDVNRNISINISQINNPKGISITYPEIVRRYAVIGQITESGWVNRHINISDKFNFLMGNKPVFEDTFLKNKLHRAVWNENEDSIPILLKESEFVNMVNTDWQTPLHIAAFKNNHNIIKQLVDSGAKVYFPDLYGNTPFHIAAAFGDNETIDFLFNAGKAEEDEFGIKGVNISNKSMETPLDLAILSNNLLTTQALLKHGAITTGWNQYGQSPLKPAIYKLNNSTDITEKSKAFEITKALLKVTKWFSPNKISVPTLSGTDSITNVFVSDLKFYESSDQITPYNQREYIRMFASTKTRYIGFEVALNYTLQTGRKDFSMKAVWYNANGKEINNDVSNMYIDSNWSSSIHTRLFGNIRYGAAWKPGLYYIDFYLNNQKVANAYFAVY